MKHIPSFDEFVNENNGSDIGAKIKKEAINKLSVFFRINPSTLQKFNFDGKDNMKELAKVLGYYIGGSEVAETYYNTVIQLIKSEMGIKESLSKSSAANSKVKKEAAIIFRDYYPKVQELDLKDIKFDGGDDPKKLLAICIKRGHSGTEQKIFSHYEFAVKKAKEYVGIDESNLVKESYDNLENYMFFNNLETLKRKIETILSSDFTQIDNILKNGHDWAESHIATATENVNQVADFLANELN